MWAAISRWIAINTAARQRLVRDGRIAVGRDADRDATTGSFLEATLVYPPETACSTRTLAIVGISAAVSDQIEIGVYRRAELQPPAGDARA
ncbi:MAG: hypothetical protein GY719_36290 [bacterium]|nr:hypothetical protein [bacterium]